METQTRFVLLMHPKEFKQEKANTGRLTHLCLSNSEIVCGVSFDENSRVQKLIADKQNFPVLLYPGKDAWNLSVGGMKRENLSGRRLVVFLLDATWACARKMLKLSRSLQALPKMMFVPTAPSRYRIKQQPQEGCLSTLETVHEMLLALEKAGIDEYPLPNQLLEIFDRMQNFQIRCAEDPNLPSYRVKHPYRDPSERKRPSGRSARRRIFFKPI